MALFEKFGEMDSAEEIQAAAEGLLNEGDMESLKALAKENGFDEDDVEDWEDFGVVITPAQAAVGKLMVEADDLKFPKDILFTDWVDYIKKMSLEDETIAVAVRKKDKSLAECIGKVMEEAFANQYEVPDKIKKGTKVKAGKVTFGVPSETSVRKIIRGYYGGQA